MDDPNGSPPSEEGELTSRAPEEADLVGLCRELNRVGARYIVVGGFAIIYAGLPRMTGDVDLLVQTGIDNEKRVLTALLTLPDKAAAELKPGEIEEYTVIRVADEIVVDLMASACGINYQTAEPEIIFEEIQGVRIPFASPRLLYRMKAPTRRAKDIADLVFLREYFRQAGEEPPAV